MFHVPNKHRVTVSLMRTLGLGTPDSRVITSENDGNNGMFIIMPKDFPSSIRSQIAKHPAGTRIITIIASDGAGWDHVSVSTPDRCPLWEEMSFIKSLFWDDEDTVVQFHPKESEYVNNHKYCLHMWRNQSQEFITPPKILVGL